MLINLKLKKKYLILKIIIEAEKNILLLLKKEK